MKKVWNFLSYVLVAVAASVATLAVSEAAADRTPAKLTELADLIEECFIGESDRTAMEDAAAEAMVASLGDRWSYYIPADEYEVYREQVNNSYVGIGISIQMMEDGSGLLVVKVNEGGPAEEAGMLAGDVIVRIEGQSTEGMSTSDARELVRGEEGSSVAITVLRGTSEVPLTITRRQVQTVVASAQMLEDNIGLVTITNFDNRCADETITAIEALLEQGAQALLFDVRNNPGGYKKELVQVLDYLLPEGPLFRSENYEGKVVVDESDASCLEIPMAVLVNGDSYSAAEFFAAAIREYDAGFVAGQQTCGKGYYQNTVRLSDGSAVGLSMGKYATPDGISLAEVGGLTPDIIIEVDEETAARIYAGTLDPAEDPQIQAAVEALKEK
ncbi:MAG: PDZ domain-containing protein [Oscillospiraceae bacterium]|nr:PDZ domain-containing protein [Oscillospiraceae bacterium]